MVQLAPDSVTPTVDAVLFDFRGTLFGDEDDTAWVRNSAAAIGRTLDDELAVAIWARDGHPDASFAFPDAGPVMQALLEHGVRMAVVSDIHCDIRDHFRRHDLDRYVDHYVLSYELGCQKPDAEMFTGALDALGITAERALMVGDTPAKDGGAAHVGICTYILRGPFRAGRRGPRGLDAVLRLAGIDAEPA